MHVTCIVNLSSSISFHGTQTNQFNIIAFIILVKDVCEETWVPNDGQQSEELLHKARIQEGIDQRKADRAKGSTGGTLN